MESPANKKQASLFFIIWVSIWLQAILNVCVSLCVPARHREHELAQARQAGLWLITLSELTVKSACSVKRNPRPKILLPFLLATAKALSDVQGQGVIWLLPWDYSDMKLSFCVAESFGPETGLITNNS